MVASNSRFDSGSGEFSIVYKVGSSEGVTREGSMNRVHTIVIGFLLCVSLLFSNTASAQEVRRIDLPKPQTEGGKPLMEALKARASSRAFSKGEIPLPVLSNLLWAAFGINRPDSGGRTAPSAKNWQEIDVYVATAKGLYLYDARKHALDLVVKEDIRALAGRQSFVADAPINLIYVADFSRTGASSNEEKELYCAADTGFIGQNVYLFCASEGLATVIRGSTDRPALAKAMKLRPTQKIMLSQTVGYPRR
jgi:SagB-type dehydrogenase family enzyme